MISFYNAVFYISCYYAAVSFALRYPAGLDHGTDHFAFSLIITAALLFAVGKTEVRGARALRIAALVLPAAALIWNHVMPGLLEYTLPWGYLVYLSYRSPRSLSHYYFKADFSHILWGFLAFFLLILFRPERGIAALSEAAPYLIVFLGAGVSLLQTLRHKEEKVKGLARHQGGQTAVFFLFCILLTAGGLLEFLEDVLLEKILRPAGLFLLNKLFALIEYFRKKLFVKKPGETKKDFLDFQKHMEKLMGKQPPEPTPEPAPLPEPVQRGEINYMLLSVLVVILAAFVIFVVLRNNAKKQVRQAAVIDEREKLPVEAGGGKKRRRKGSPQETVREHYRKFMRMADGSAHKLKAQDTTKEIREKYVQGKEEEKAAEYAGELTEIYRAVRYGDRAGGNGAADPGFDMQSADMRQQAKRMKILLDYLKKV